LEIAILASVWKYLLFIEFPPPRAAASKDCGAAAARTEAAAARGRAPSVAEAPKAGLLRELPCFIGM